MAWPFAPPQSPAPTAEIILLTAYGNIVDGVQAMKGGAFDCLTKGDQLLVVVERAVEKARLQRRVVNLEKQVGAQGETDITSCYATLSGTSGPATFASWCWIRF